MTKQGKIALGGKTIILETGLFGAQASGAVTARCGDTVVLATVVVGPRKDGIDFFPLTVEYREKHYAGGVISSSRFIKREGRPADSEILTSRLIDRSIRPLFPNGFLQEVQVVATPLSVDGENEPEILAIIAVSAALRISNIPWEGPVGAVRLGFNGSEYLVNPSETEKLKSQLDMVVSGGLGSIAMVEAGALEVSESVVLGALNEAQKQIENIISSIEEFAKDVTKTKVAFVKDEANAALVKLVAKKLDVAAILEESKTIGGEGIKLSPIADKLMVDAPDANKSELINIIDEAIKEFVRKQVLEKKTRFDGRKLDEIRPISVQVGLLPRTHGSGFFQRGLTHALSIVTLGSPEDQQLIDGMKGEETKRYMHHYNMPGFATGEPGRIGNPNRREIGHGALAERALIPMLPSKEEFPYTIRVVTEIMSGNGSTSQASVCGSTLALMDAGVPIKKPVAGIAMGLITKDDQYVTLSDIAGIEDHLGDMDFKVAGTNDGITAIQMDVKIKGVTASILETALEQARIGRLHILSKMLEVISVPNETVSQYAPKLATVTIPVDKIGELIGPGGKNIRALQTTNDVEISVDDAGFVTVIGADLANVSKVRDYIHGMMQEAEVGKIYQGTVTRVEGYGCFVEILPGKEGLVHVSRMSTQFVEDANALVKVGDLIQVKCYEVDGQGRINLTMLLNDEGRAARPESNDRPRRPFQNNRNSSDRPSRPGFGKFRDHRS